MTLLLKAYSFSFSPRRLHWHGNPYLNNGTWKQQHDLPPPAVGHPCHDFPEYIPETTKIIIAQRTSSVEDADRIIVMNDGRIDQIGTSEELLKTNAIYREVYLSQNRQGTENIEEQEVAA